MENPLDKSTKQQILLDFKEIAEKTAKLLMKKQKVRDQLAFHYKDSSKHRGLVSEADTAAEELILDFLGEQHPQIPALSEEMAHQQQITDYSPFQQMPACFVIDPLDGSSNFIHGLDYYCISLALLEFGKPQAGLVLRPSTGESFWAMAHEGAHYQRPYASDKRLYLQSKNTALESCLFATGLRLPKLVDSQRIKSVRQMGSAALDLCHVALEKFDGYCARGLSPWDVAGAAIILQEANIAISDFQGQELDCFGRTFLAAPQGIHQELQKIL